MTLQKRIPPLDAGNLVKYTELQASQNEENTRKEFEKFEGKSRESVYFLKNLIYWNHTE